MRWLLPLPRERRCKSLSSHLRAEASRLSSVDKAGAELLRSRLSAFAEELLRFASEPLANESKAKRQAAYRTAQTVLIAIQSLSNGGQRNLKRKEVVQLLQLLEANAATGRSIQSAGRNRTFGPPSQHPKTLGKVAGQYAAQAEDEKKASRHLRGIAWAFLLLATIVAVTGLSLASMGRVDPGWPTAYFGIVAIFVAALGTMAIAISERHRHAGLELNRLRQHLDALEPYLQPMDKETASLIRAVLAARIFSRVSSEDESLWEPLWPSAEQLLAVRQNESRHYR